MRKGSCRISSTTWGNIQVQVHVNQTQTVRGCRDGAGVRALASHQCGPGLISRSGVKSGLGLLALYLALRGFLRELRFPLSSKSNIWLDCFNC